MAKTTQEPLQLLCPSAQINRHVPELQVSPDGQEVPQAPQLPTSEANRTHLSPQFVSPDEQTSWFLAQLPETHENPSSQAVPQLPQWAELVASSTHDPPQFIVLPPQTMPQDPLKQLCPEGQEVPQLPQL